MGCEVDEATEVLENELLLVTFLQSKGGSSGDVGEVPVI